MSRPPETVYLYWDLYQGNESDVGTVQWTTSPTDDEPNDKCFEYTRSPDIFTKEQIARILWAVWGVDGGCAYCAGHVVSRLRKAFPDDPFPTDADTDERIDLMETEWADAICEVQAELKGPDWWSI